MKQSERLALPIQILLASAFLMNTGAFMALPFLTIYLTTTLHFMTWQVGTILSVNLLSTQLLPMATGLMGDRVGHMRMIVLGIVVRGLGFLGFSIFVSFGGLLATAALVGLGGALYSPALDATFAMQPENLRQRTFTLHNQALNLGAVVGPLIGGGLIAFAPTLPFRIGGLVLVVLAGGLFTQRDHYVTTRTQTTSLVSLGHVVGHRRFMGFTAVMIIFWMLFAQLTVSLPLAAWRLGHSDSAASAVFIVNGVAGVALMFGLARLFRARPPVLLVRWGLLCVGVGLALIALIPALAWLLGCVALYTLGETLVLPGADMAVAQFSTEGASGDVGAFFGCFSLSWAIGGTIGNYLGTWLMAHGGPQWPWLIYGLLGIGGFVLMRLVERFGAAQSRRPTTPVAPMQLVHDE